MPNKNGQGLIVLKNLNARWKFQCHGQKTTSFWFLKIWLKVTGIFRDSRRLNLNVRWLMEQENTSQIQILFLWLFSKLCFFSRKIWNHFTSSCLNQSERCRGKKSLSGWSADSRLTLPASDEVMQTQALLHFKWSLVKKLAITVLSRPCRELICLKQGLECNRGLELCRPGLHFAVQHVIWKL